MDDLTNPQKLSRIIQTVRSKKNRNPEENLIDILRQGMKLGYTLAGQNTTNFDNKTIKLASPRFFGLVPETKEKEEASR